MSRHSWCVAMLEDSESARWWIDVRVKQRRLPRPFAERKPQDLKLVCSVAIVNSHDRDDHAIQVLAITHEVSGHDLIDHFFEVRSSVTMTSH